MDFSYLLRYWEIQDGRQDGRHGNRRKWKCNILMNYMEEYFKITILMMQTYSHGIVLGISIIICLQVSFVWPLVKLKVKIKPKTGQISKILFKFFAAWEKVTVKWKIWQIRKRHWTFRQRSWSFMLHIFPIVDHWSSNYQINENIGPN